MNRSYRFLTALVFGLAMTAATQAAESRFLHSNDPDLSASARSLPVGTTLRLGAVPLGGLGQGETGDAVLERFEVFAPDAEVVVNGTEHVAVPKNAYFQGEVAGMPGSRLLLTVPEQGLPRGLLFADGKVAVLEGIQGRSGAAGLAARSVDVKRELDPLASNFHCDLEQAHSDASALLQSLSTQNFTSSAEAEIRQSDSPAETRATTRATTVYSAHLVLETDYQFYALFNDVTRATSYAGDLVAYTSAMYRNEISAGLTLDKVNIYTTSAASPWTAATTIDSLYQLRNYYIANKASVARSVVHLLSGKPLGGGVAYIGTLCNNSYGYGVSGNISGGFSLANPSAAWDIVAFSHELGHNFNSPHSHCYANLGGSTSPVDGCYAQEQGCYAGSQALPGIGSLIGGTAGTGNGTIMSYCHLLSGGMRNISLTLGKSSTYGVAASRIPSRMASFVTQQASAYPSCLTATTTGTTYALSVALPSGGKVTSAPAGINCGGTGTACSYSYNANAVVVLTATPNSGATFAGWGGACTGTAATCSVTMSAARSVTASFRVGTTYALTVTRPTGGNITSSPAGISCGTGTSCSYSFAANSLVTLTATPGSGATFAGWSGACTGTAATCTVTMSAAKSVGASFRAGTTYPLTVTSTAGGNVTSSPAGISCGTGTSCSYNFAANALVTLTATPGSGANFAGWSGACTGTATSCTVAMNAAKSVSATFRAGSQTVSATGYVNYGQWSYYQISVPSTLTKVTATVSSMTADTDLYVRKGALPNNISYTCRSVQVGTAIDSCTAVNAGTNIWYIGVLGKGAASFKVTVTASP